MVAFRLFLFTALALGATAQVSFDAPENSGQILSLLRDADQATVLSGERAARYRAGVEVDYTDLADANAKLLAAWQAIGTTASSSGGFYTDAGAQAILEFVTNKLGPNTLAANQIYVKQRNEFSKGPRPFINYIGPGLIKLKVAVADAASAVAQRCRATDLTPTTLAFLNIAQDYSNTQEIQQFGPQTPIYKGHCGCSSRPQGNGQMAFAVVEENFLDGNALGC
ncbi:hypothetical protein CERZMDRAFT_108668 [Cercospora zeae-maydis SCOH1-5]|uniref:Uncharacterized protein n=1 Tax=Cercospora zeae-maydis SCOH1-5 TaxID=717836 RepID=A0A6A6FT79_9PEZI|nr:hypothetical protein CERZMDRAFT_108668 [Cercospora zeae-maydis SCOH1-5]